MFSKIKALLSTFSCQRYTELASRKLDARLPHRDRFTYYLHHLVCTFCRRSTRQMALIEKGASRILSQDMVASEDGATLSPEAKEKIRRTLPGE